MKFRLKFGPHSLGRRIGKVATNRTFYEPNQYLTQWKHDDVLRNGRCSSAPRVDALSMWYKGRGDAAEDPGVDH